MKVTTTDANVFALFAEATPVSIHLIQVDGSEERTLTFPRVTKPTVITVVEYNGGARNIRVAVGTGEAINGEATFVMSAGAYQSARFGTSGNGEWLLID